MIKIYKKLTKSLVGTTIKDFYCNGYFGRDYNLENSIIKKIYRLNDSEKEIYVIIEKTNGEIKTACFEGNYNNWEFVYKSLKEWTS